MVRFWPVLSPSRKTGKFFFSGISLLENTILIISLFQCCVQILMDRAVSLLCRPKILKRLAEGPLVWDLSHEQHDDSNAVDTSDELITVKGNSVQIVTQVYPIPVNFAV